MDFLIQRKTLIDALATVLPSADRRSAMPALRCVRISARGERVSFETFDLFQRTTRFASGIVRAEGHAFVNAVRAIDVARQLAADEVRVAIRGELVEIGTQRSSISIPVVAEGFDAGDRAAYTPIELPPRVVAEALGAVERHMGRDMSRPVFCGCLLELRPGSIRAVAIDGHALACVTRSIVNAATLDLRIPLHTVKQIRVCAERAHAAGESFSLGMAGQNIVATSGRTSISAKAMEEELPPYGKVIPTKHRHRVVAPRLALIAALKRASCSAKGTQPWTKVSFADGVMSIGNTVAEHAQSRDEIDVGGTDGSSVFGMNPAYMLNALVNIATDYVAIEMTDEHSPIAMRPIDGHDDVFIACPARLT